MPNLQFKFHYLNKNNSFLLIDCSEDDSISELINKFLYSISSKEKEYVFYYKGSELNYKEMAYIKDKFCKNSFNDIINIFAISLKRNFKSDNDKKNISKEASVYKQEKGNPKNLITDKKDKERALKEEKIFNDIICPICKTSAIIEIDGLNLNIINCENFHRISKLKFDVYDEYEFDLDDRSEKNIDKLRKMEMLKCQLCSGHIAEDTPPENKIYICTCGENLCSSCFKNHNDIDHHKIEYKYKNYYCLTHGKEFNSYCLDCNMNICQLCKDLHLDNHEILEYQYLKPKSDYIDKLFNKIEEQKKELNKFVENSRKVIYDIINEIQDYINKYISIENTLLFRYSELKTLNFQLLQNLRNVNIYEGNVIFKVFKIFDNKPNLLEKLKYLMNIYEVLISIKNEVKQNEDLPKANTKNELTIKYKIKEKRINRKVKIFDALFVENNKDKCSFTILKDNEDRSKDGNETLCEYINNFTDAKEITVILKEKNNSPITNMSYMFNNCEFFESVDFKDFNTINIANMESMFQLTHIKAIPDLSKFNTTSLTNIKAMFSKCTNLTDIPQEIQYFKTSNIKDMSFLFNGCKSLISIPNLHKWDTRNLEDMSYMFNRCINLKDLHGIGRWNTSNVKNISGMFNKCENLLKLPDISKWNTSNVTDMSIIFQFCNKLKEIPDIHKWNVSKVKNMSGVFSGCKELKSLQYIGKWQTNEVTNMSTLFNKCTNLSVFPDMSKWNTSNTTNMSGMFRGCTSMKILPNISSWNTSNVTNMSYMFDGCSELENISFINYWDISNVKNKTNALKGTKIKENEKDDWMKKTN